MKIVVLDAIGLHAGFLGFYGNDWVATPALDALACEGVVFDNHIADFPLLDAAATSAARTGAHGFSGQAAVDVCQLLSRRGWQVDVATPGSLIGLAAGLRPYLERWRPEADALLWVDGPALTPPWSLPDDLLNSYFADDFEEEEGDATDDGDQSEEEEEDEEPDAEPAAGAAPLPDLTPWPDPPQGFVGPLELADWQRLRNTYAAVVTYFDAQVGKLCRRLVEGGWSEDVLLIVTARSSLPLGEHGQIGAGLPWLHEERVHVPLLMRFPREKHAGLRIAALTQPADLVPTVLEILGLSGDNAAGFSLMPLVEAEAGEPCLSVASASGSRVHGVRPFALSLLEEGGTREAALRTDQCAFLLPLEADPRHPARRGQLYLKPEDRWEVNDLAAKEIDRCEELERQLRAALT